MSALPGYFIDYNAHGELWLWRVDGDNPEPVLASWDLRGDPDVWDVLVQATREVSQT